MYKTTFLAFSIILLFGCGSNKETVQLVTVQGRVDSYKLSQVELLQSPFYEAQNTDLDYIIELDPDRLLAPYLIEGGLQPKAEKYGNWENTGLDGHIGGHYVSALSNMYAATDRSDVKERLDYVISELKRAQDNLGTGYLGGIPGSNQMWAEIKEGNIRAGSFSLNDRWVPLYNIHKIYAGLRDAYQIADIEEAKRMLIRLTDWMLDVTANLSDEQIQEMLRSEHGGLNETFADVYEITGEEKYLELARRFSHNHILDPLVSGEDKLSGMHANTQIPKIIGFEKVSELAGDENWHKASEFFWNTVVENRSITIGGNSVREHFNPVDDFSSMINSNQGPETCNTYNMLRLSKMLFLNEPQSKYLNFYEKGLYNHILSSQHPDGGFVYFTPIRPQHYRVYSQVHEGFWCCVGSGIENHGKYGELVYTHQGDDLMVNLFIPSVLNWEEKGIKLKQNASFDISSQVDFTLELDQPMSFKLLIRKPEWIEDGSVQLSVNGLAMDIAGDGAYIEISNDWKSGDQISMIFRMKTKVDRLPDGSDWVSFSHGPFVLGAVTDTENTPGLFADDSRMTHIAQGDLYPIDEAPLIVSNDVNSLAGKIEPTSGEGLEFSFSGNINQDMFKNLKLVPFYTIHEARYMLYWPVISEDGLEKRMKEVREQERIALELEAKTVDQIGTGEQQPESDHGFKAVDTESGMHAGKFWRHASGWFSYNLNNPDKEGKILRITYFGGDSGRSFYIKMDEQLLADVTLERQPHGDFYDVDYQIPQDILDNMKDGKLNLKFEAKPGSIAGGIYYVRLLKAE